MNGSPHQTSLPQFGGNWTEQKLSVLRKYLNAYTTALSKLNFRTVYIDAFAGAGAREEADTDGVQFVEGSAKIALDVRKPSFDRLVFIEEDFDYANNLRKLVAETKAENRARIEQADANVRLPIEVERLVHPDRAVVFIDPFGTQAHWKTIASLMQYPGIDAWILFPVGTICRLMPIHRQPTSAKTREKLDAIFGTPEWQELYDQEQFFGDAGRLSKTTGVNAIVALYRKQLDKEFAGIANQSVALVNSKNSRLYQLLFVMTNPSTRAQELALGMADDIMKNV